MHFYYIKIKKQSHPGSWGILGWDSDRDKRLSLYTDESHGLCAGVVRTTGLRNWENSILMGNRESLAKGTALQRASSLHVRAG